MCMMTPYGWSIGLFVFFFFNDTATTEIYTLSLHDALPICTRSSTTRGPEACRVAVTGTNLEGSSTATSNPTAVVTPYAARLFGADRKSTRLNSSHANISYAVFCLKKKKNIHLAFLHAHDTY